MVFVTDRAQHRGEKIADKIVRVKADDTGTEQAFDDLLAPAAREHAENFPGGKRDVQEKADGHFWKFFAHQFWQQHQVVIVDPQDVIGPQRGDDGVGEGAIYLLVLLPITFFVPREGGKIMEQRPDGLVAEAKIEAVHAFFRQKNRGGIELLAA